MRARCADRRGQVEIRYLCIRSSASRCEPHCQSIAVEMTPAPVELALDIRKEIAHRNGEADDLRLRAVERAGIDAELAQRRFMLADPNNRLVAAT